MSFTPPTRAPSRAASTRRPPKTWAGVAVTATLAATVPLALVALAHPTAVATLLVSVGAAAPVVRRDD